MKLLGQGGYTGVFPFKLREKSRRTQMKYGKKVEKSVTGSLFSASLNERVEIRHVFTSKIPCIDISMDFRDKRDILESFISDRSNAIDNISKIIL